MFQHILVPLDGSAEAERAVAVAARLAQTAGGVVTLLRVIHPYWEPDAAVAGITELANDDREAKEAMAYLAEARASEALADVASGAVVGIGSVAPAILAAALENHVDLIVLFQHRRRARLGRWPLGGITEQIVKRAAAPVLVLHEHNVAPATSETVRLAARG